MTGSEIKADFLFDIIEGKYTLKEVQKKIKSFEAEYGNEFFSDYDIKIKEKPWDKEYLDELKIKGMTGMASKQFYLHVAEVSEYVHDNCSKKEIHKKIYRNMKIGAVVGILIVIVITILSVFKVKG